MEKCQHIYFKFNNRCYEIGLTFHSPPGVVQVCGVRYSQRVKVKAAFWRGYHMYTSTKIVLARRKNINIVHLPWFLYNSPFPIHAIIPTLELSVRSNKHQNSTYLAVTMELDYLPKMYTYPNRSNVFKMSGQTSAKPFDSTQPIQY